MPEASEALELVRGMGFEDAALIDAGNVVVAEWVRMKCKYGCPYYSMNLMCPPFTPTAEETRRLVHGYERALLLRVKAEDVFDRAENLRMKEVLAELERDLLLAGFYKVLALGSGPCLVCGECNLTDGRCRKPELARPSMEACGIDVFATARVAGFKLQVVRTREEKPTYYALILLE